MTLFHYKIPFLIIALVLALPWSKLSAQDWKTITPAEQQKLMQPTLDYMEQQQFSYKVKYSSFIGHKGNTVAEEMWGHYARIDKEFYCNMPGNLSVQNSEIRLEVDTTEKLVVLRSLNNKGEDKLLDSQKEWMLQNAKAIQYAEMGGEKVVRLILPEFHEVEEERLYYAADGLLKKVILYYREALPIDPEDPKSAKEKARIEIDFSNWSTKANIPPRWKVDALVKKDKKNFIPIGRFSKYEVIDFRYQ
jgi:hypothetical protein